MSGQAVVERQVAARMATFLRFKSQATMERAMQSARKVARDVAGNRRLSLALVAAGVICCLCLSGCGAGQMRDLYDERNAIECFNVAPIIVVGRIVSVTPLGPPRRSSAPPHPRMQPLNLMVSVENVLKGHVPGPTIAVLAFYVAEGTTGPKRFAPALDGERIRRLFALRWDRERLRVLLDTWSGGYARELYSGDHRGAHLPSDPAKAMAAVMLTLGKDWFPHAFAMDIIGSTIVALNLSRDPEYVVSLLQPLAASENAEVREQAQAAIKLIQSHRFTVDTFASSCPAKL